MLGDPPKTRASRAAGSGNARAASRYWTLLKAEFKNRKCILIGGQLAGRVGFIRLLRALGARKPFVLAGSQGFGDLPGNDEADVYFLNIQSGTILDERRALASILHHLPREAIAALDKYDPGCEAIALGSTTYTDDTFAGRRYYGPERLKWIALDDKIIVDAFWDSIGVTRAPSVVVAAEAGALCAAHKRLDTGSGTVWAGDAREGPNSYAAYQRWVRNMDHIAQSGSFFASHCDKVRVMPFLEGIPCSIHGLTSSDGVAVFNPVEIVTLRVKNKPEFLYAGTSSVWSPSALDRERMRDLARCVGVELVKRLTYRGAYCIDGVLTSDGFLPTELNLRFTSGLSTISRSCPNVPLFPLSLAMREMPSVEFEPKILETLVLDAVERERFADVVVAAGRWPLAGDGDTGGGRQECLTLNVGSESGELAVVEIFPVNGRRVVAMRFANLRPEQFVAPQVAHVLEHVDKVLELGLGEVAAANPVSPSSNP